MTRSSSQDIISGCSNSKIDVNRLVLYTVFYLIVDDIRLRAVLKGKRLRKGGTADNAERNDIRISHTTQNSHW